MAGRKVYQRAPKVSRSSCRATASSGAGLGSLIIFKIIDYTVGLRPTVEKEREGLDLTDHGERAYNM